MHRRSPFPDGAFEAASHPEFLSNTSRKMLGYALGCEVKRADMKVVDDCVHALEKGDFRASQLLETIVVGYPFAHRCQK